MTRTGRTIEGVPQPPTTTIFYVPSRQQKKRKSTSNVIKEKTSPDHSLLTDIKKLQRRMARLCKEQKRATTELAKLRTRLEKRLAKE